MISRRVFLSSSLAAGCALSHLRAEVPALNAFSNLKRKLTAGESATLLIISDSTGYKDTSGTRRFLRSLAEQYPTHRVTEHYWAEWELSKPTGPRRYAEPIAISKGTSGATLTVLNAVLPGAVAQAFIDGSRWTNMLAPLAGEAPDLILWNHGHNHQGGNAPKNYPYARGSFLAPIGRVGMDYPDTPQAAIIQNPWRDNDGYDRVRDWWLDTARAMPSLTLVDGFTPFVAKQKHAELFQDNVHPNNGGYELIHQALLAAWQATEAGTSPALNCWSNQSGEALFPNGDLAGWTEALPARWRLIHGAQVRKETKITYGGAPHSIALTGVTQNDGLQLSLTGDALAQVRGKRISFAVLCYVPADAEQDIQVKFTTNSTDQVTGSAQFARDNWKWIVMAGVEVPAEASLAFVGIYRSFAKPPGELPFYIQRAVIVEGDAPRGKV